MDSATILVDTREQKPLHFPATLRIASPCGGPTTRLIRLHTKKATLKTADYGVEDSAYGLGRTLIVERKHSLAEIHRNLTTKREQFVRVLESMKAISMKPVLIYDTGLESFLAAKPAHVPVEGAVVVDRLLRLCYSYGVEVHVLDGGSVAKRARVAEFVARMLVNGVLCRSSA